MKLYELTGQFRKLEDMAATIDTPEDCEAFSALWAEIADDFQVKAERTAMVIKNLTAEADAIKAEEDRLRARRKALESSADSLKSYLEAHMIATGIEKVKGNLFTLAIQANPPAVNVDPLKLPDEWYRVKREFDTARIKEALKEGQEIPGASLVQSRGLRIR